MIVTDTNTIAYLYLPTAIAMQSQAEQQLADNEYTVNTMDVLALASDSGCSAYDYEFISLAKYDNQADESTTFISDRFPWQQKYQSL